MPRLGSKKSRNGCQQCKARRVKCDEDRPCANCSKYRVQCSLLSAPTPVARASSRHTSQTPSTSRDVSSTPGPSHSVSASPTPSNRASSRAYAASPVAPVQLDVGVAGSWMQDLELMHHYTAHAFLTLPGVEQSLQTWGYAAPQEAFRYSFFMHALLAFSAYHLAHTTTSPRAGEYRILASTHQTAAITGMNRVLPDVTPDNCHALFGAASLITLNAFADASTYTLDVLVDIFRLLRGTSLILYSTEPMIERGPFSLLFQHAQDSPKPPSLLSTFLAELKATGCGLDEAPGNSAYKATVTLRECIEYTIENLSCPEFRIIVLWPVRLEADFVDALKSPTDPAVLALLQKYGRLLEYAGTQWWFLSGWRNISQQFQNHPSPHTPFSSETPTSSC